LLIITDKLFEKFIPGHAEHIACNPRAYSPACLAVGWPI
jgi:hypothetical protein